MNWSIKFAYNDLEELERKTHNNLPWIVVDDGFVSEPNGAPFIKRQKELMLQRGFDWLKQTLRGRFYPELNVTTVTTINGEKHPELGDPPIDKVQAKFPGVAILSLIGGPHLVSGWVSPEVVNAIGKKANRWQRIYKEADFSPGLVKWLKSVGIPATTLLALFSAQGIDIGKLTEEVARNPNVAPQQILDQVQVENNNPKFNEENLFQNSPEESVDIVQPETRIDRDLHTGNLEGLDSVFSGKVEQILWKLSQQGWQPRVAEGLRTLEQQQKKMDQGRSSLKNPQNSKHVQGLAVDIIDSRYGWNGPASDLNFAFWNDLGQAARDVGLTWGGDWKTFKDVAHIQAEETTEMDKRSSSYSKNYRYAYFSHRNHS